MGERKNKDFEPGEEKWIAVEFFRMYQMSGEKYGSGGEICEAIDRRVGRSPKAVEQVIQKRGGTIRLNPQTLAGERDRYCPADFSSAYRWLKYLFGPDASIEDVPNVGTWLEDEDDEQTRAAEGNGPVELPLETAREDGRVALIMRDELEDAPDLYRFTLPSEVGTFTTIRLSEYYGWSILWIEARFEDETGELEATSDVGVLGIYGMHEDGVEQFQDEIERMIQSDRYVNDRREALRRTSEGGPL